MGVAVLSVMTMVLGLGCGPFPDMTTRHQIAERNRSERAAFSNITILPQC